MSLQPNLRAWMGASKVVTGQSEPLVLYHASCNTWDGDAFRRKKSKGGSMSLGYHFGTAAAAEERIQPAVDDVATWNWTDLAPHTMAVYLRIENPIRLRDIGAWHDPEWIIKALKEAGIAVQSGTVASITKELKQLGYDGIVYTNKFEAAGSESWVAFDPKQIKSAIGNSGLFDRDSDSLLDRIYEAEDEICHPHERMRA